MNIPPTESFSAIPAEERFRVLNPDHQEALQDMVQGFAKNTAWPNVALSALMISMTLNDKAPSRVGADGKSRSVMSWTCALQGTKRDVAIMMAKAMLQNPDFFKATIAGVAAAVCYSSYQESVRQSGNFEAESKELAALHAQAKDTPKLPGNVTLIMNFFKDAMKHDDRDEAIRQVAEIIDQMSRLGDLATEMRAFLDTQKAAVHEDI